MPVYFSFGSNMDLAQMGSRCPGAKVLDVGVLYAHRLVFRGPSRKRGGGVASVDAAVGGLVRGLLWRVSDRDLAALDRFEGAPEWYVRAAVAVSAAAGGVIPAVTYRLPSGVAALMEPTPAYLDQVTRARARLDFPTAELQAALAMLDRSAR